ncbi:DUF1127 domain-containing protein [Actibacterium lipolyticum]|uniref:YjiS-like domain-containing protein n=1 Tax=Actibacterium lipolyticum TaxID=1524263 RepID=A0A238JSV4_9RHOB|nr:DUF1127 domain-containing protein [Actibacterium lipolyticum]SMX33741.1 hypothetical protein COL8621_01089 [Actibacterium lipolyticum]
MAHAQHIQVAHNGFGEWLRQVIAVTRDALERRRVYRQTVSELGALSNRELADLGISRSMIRSLAKETAYGA